MAYKIKRPTKRKIKKKPYTGIPYNTQSEADQKRKSDEVWMPGENGGNYNIKRNRAGNILKYERLSKKDNSK